MRRGRTAEFLVRRICGNRTKLQYDMKSSWRSWSSMESRRGTPFVLLMGARLTGRPAAATEVGGDVLRLYWCSIAGRSGAGAARGGDRHWVNDVRRRCGDGNLPALSYAEAFDATAGRG
jgi:hypothetical protein